VQVRIPAVLSQLGSKPLETLRSLAPHCVCCSAGVTQGDMILFILEIRHSLPLRRVYQERALWLRPQNQTLPGVIMPFAGSRLQRVLAVLY
jgi:hypothetical protein